ncbi:L-arabinose isomerase [Azotosporobacter soli]|uniref:L-arabinose isomerase n=1 Tax=Azotosporobacter soli TaxID=3055040 RepID=UPI0031FF166E
MKSFTQQQFWFITGSQHLYGEETLRQVAENSRQIVEQCNASAAIPAQIVLKEVATGSNAIEDVIAEANYDQRCAGIITWMHTFSPAKMWIRGLGKLQKPYLHLHTQFNREIPNDTIDMDFMNLNQAAHGDREHAFIAARMRLPRKIVVGHWAEPKVQEKIGRWMRSAVGVSASKKLKVARFGDNMREVAVTEGDKVEAQLKLGWSVNTYPVGDLLPYVERVTEGEIDKLLEEYKAAYQIKTENLSAVRYQARLEIGIESFLKEGGFEAFTNTFEDLHGLEQLPGLAVQRLMEKGYGFGPEGDWKVAAMSRIMKQMAQGLTGGTSLMEDYTYHFDGEESLILGAHMLEICPSLAAEKPRIEVHPLGIGGKDAPARLVFEGKSGKAVCASLVDMGGRMRLIVNDVLAVAPTMEMPNLPVARVMWKPMPTLETAAEAWLSAGGAHHSVFSFALDAQMLRDWANALEIEFVHIDETLELDRFRQDLLFADLAWKLK